MSTQLQLRRGTTTENAAFTGAQGELTYNTETHSLKVHDGATVGGYGLPVLVAVQRPTAENGYTWYRKWSDGWVEQGGIATTTSAVTITVNLPITMADNSYCVLTTGCAKDAQDHNTSSCLPVVNNVTTTSFDAWIGWVGINTTSTPKTMNWMVSGYAA